MSEFRPVLDYSTSNLPAPIAGIFDEPCVCIHVNQAWAGFLSGYLERLALPDMFGGDNEFSEQQILKLIAALGDDMACGGGCGCEALERELQDDLSSWVVENSDEIKQFDNNLSSVFPSLPDEFFFNEDVYRKVVCYALFRLFTEADRYRLALAQTSPTPIQGNTARLATTIAGVVGGGLLAASGVFRFIPVYAGLPALVFAGLGTVFFAIRDQMTNDPEPSTENEIEDIVCCVYDTLALPNIGINNLLAVIAGCISLFGSNDKRADVILASQVMLNRREFQFEFMSSINQIYQQTVGNAFLPNPAHLPCPCVGEDTWAVDINGGNAMFNTMSILIGEVKEDGVYTLPAPPAFGERLVMEIQVPDGCVVDTITVNARSDTNSDGADLGIGTLFPSVSRANWDFIPVGTFERTLNQELKVQVIRFVLEMLEDQPIFRIRMTGRGASIAPQYSA